MNELVKADLQAMSDPFDKVLAALLTALEARDLPLRRRAERVAALAVQMAQQMGLDEVTCRQLSYGALLHDIGNIGIPDAILLKPCGLSDWEFQEVKLHPIIGEQIIKPLPSLQSVRPLIRSHHEKLDGSGYPDRLKGDEILLQVRILSVADIYHTLRSVRAYRPPFLHAQAMDTINQEVRNGWWDKSVVDQLNNLPPQPDESFGIL